MNKIYPYKFLLRSFDLQDDDDDGSRCTTMSVCFLGYFFTK